MAKELRAAARAGDPGAVQRLRNHVDADPDPATVSLSAAQLVVAREHGFASWPRLMEHLEARRLPALSSLAPRRAVAASALDDEQTVVLAGRVTSIVSDAQDGGRLWLRVVPVFGTAPGEAPDQREVILSCRGDARVRTARRVPSGEQSDAPGLTSGPDRFAIEGVVGVERVKPVPGCPGQERADAFALVGAVAGAVGVDVGLGEGGRPHAQAGGPGQEGLSLDEPGPGVLGCGGAQRPGGGLARIAGSWCHSPNWRSSRWCGCPAMVSNRRSSHAPNSRSCRSAAGSTPQLTSKSRK
jgi:hypothetical protein